jgi:hypothetical protein
MKTTVSGLGLTLTHILGSCEVGFFFYSDKPQVYVVREKGKKCLFANGDLDTVIKTGKVRNSEKEMIVLTAYEQEFIMKFKPIFDELRRINVEKLYDHILKGE